MPKLATLPVNKRDTRQGAAPKPSRRMLIKGRHLAVLLVVGWAAYYYFHVQYPQLRALDSKRAALQQALTDAQAKHKELVQQATEFQNDDFIARYASEHYNLILPGQVAFNVAH